MEGLARRLSDLWSGLFDALVRDNKVLPPVIALLALLLFAWVAAGAFLPDPDDERASGEAELVQSRDPAGAPAPGVEDRDADSYAAYRNKDPFRQLLAPADSASGDTPPSSASPPSGDASQDDPPEEADPGGASIPPDNSSDDTNPGGASTPPDSTTGNNTGGAGGDSGTGDDGTGGDGTGGAGGGQRSENDSDGDGLTNREEERLGQDPRDPDTDDDGTEDGADDSDGDDVPDGQGGDGGGAGDANGSDDELFDSGGSLRPR